MNINTRRITEETKDYKKSTRIDEYENGNSTTSTILTNKDEIIITGPSSLCNKNHQNAISSR